jgi:HupE / UreJ protein
MLNRWIRFAAALILCAGFGSVAARAHELPLDRIINGFVKIDPHEAHLVIRVPLDLLRGVPLSLAGYHYNISASRPGVETALKALASLIELWEDNVRLVPSSDAGQLAPLANRSFESFDGAVAHLAAPADPDAKIDFELGYLDAHFIYPISSPKSVFSIETRFAADLGNYIKLAIRFIPLGETGRAILITGWSDRVPLDPAWYQAAAGFVALGIGHILSGIDHMLFLLCLIIPLRRVKELIPVVTAFTVGHSITLIGTAYNLAPVGPWFPPFVEAAIAASIVYMALENIVGANLRRRWIISGLFGLVHGFGFADVLREQLQFSGSHLLLSLLSFNVGIEIGQLIVLCLYVPALALILRGKMSGRMGVMVTSAIVGLIAWHWMVERGEILWQTPWPPITMEAIFSLARWVFAILLAVGAAQLLAKWIEHKWPQFVPKDPVPVIGQEGFGHG